MSACCRVRTSGGESRSAFRPAPRTSRPRLKASSTTAVAFGGRALLRRPVAHELDADHQAPAAHVADQRDASPAARATRRSGVPRRSPALATSRSLTSCSVARAAAHDTGLPPNVLACAPGGHVMTSARAAVTPRGSPDATPFAMLTMSAFRPKCSEANIRPVRPMPRLHLVDDHQHAVLARQRLQARVELRRRHEVAALALDRLDDDGRHLVGRDEVHEDLLLEEAETLGLARVGPQTDRAAVAVGVRRVKHPGCGRAEALALHGPAGGQRKRAQRAAVERPEERDQERPLRACSAPA